MKIKITYRKLLILFLGVWFLISLGRLFVYAYKTAVDISIWVPFSIEKKRITIYGDGYPLAKKIENIIPRNKTILLVTNDGWRFFLLRYLTYPRRVTWIHDQTYNGKIDSYNYLVIYSPSDIDSKNRVLKTNLAIKNGIVYPLIIKNK